MCSAQARPAYSGRDLLTKGNLIYHYANCSACGVTFIDPMPDADTIAGFYHDDYMVYQPAGTHQPSVLKRAVYKWCYNYRHLSAPILVKPLALLLGLFRYRDTVPWQTGTHGLDIGCANGKFITTMNQLGWQFEGVEFNETAVDVCRQNNLKVFHGSLPEAQFTNDSFDLVTARHVIEHIPDPHQFIGEIARIMCRGALLILQTPNADAFFRRQFAQYWYPNDIPRHLILYDKKAMHSLMAQHGLKPITEKSIAHKKYFFRSVDYLIKETGRGTLVKTLKPLIKLFYPLITALNKGDKLFLIYE